MASWLCSKSFVLGTEVESPPMTFEDALEEVANDVARETAEEFRQKAIERLREVGSRLDYDVEPIIASATEVEEQPDGSYSFRFTHPASAIIEFGSDPHTITPNDPDGVLAWEENGETIFATRVEHPGTTAVLFVSKSQQEITERGLSEARLNRLQTA